jgi:uncharacterized Zn finger protein
LAYDDSGYGGFPPYVSVGERKREAAKIVRKLRSKDKNVSPIVVGSSHGKIAKSFWGNSWCKNIESYRDMDYRLERGRSYVRSGAVVDLRIRERKVVAKVNGSELYDVEINFTKISKPAWQSLAKKCTDKIGSIVELLTGDLSKNIMSVITGKSDGLFPSPKEIKFSCSCPDYATVCKHVAATLYGIGVQFDDKPDLFFLLRGINPQDLITEASSSLASQTTKTEDEFSSEDISNLFGIEVDHSLGVAAKKAGTRRKAKKTSPKQVKKKIVERKLNKKALRKPLKKKPAKKKSTKIK